MKQPNKIDLVWRHLTKKRSITSMDAWQAYNVTRLADIVHELRTRYGVEISTELVKSGATRYARYRLVGAY